MPTFTPRINLEKPDTGDKTWETAVENWAEKVDELAAQVVCIHLGGAAIDEEVIFDGFYFDEDITITKVTLYAREAPVGAALTFDILKNGVEMAKTFSIADSAKKANAALAGVAFTTLEEFGMKVKNVGSTTEGSEVTIVVHYQINALP